MPLYVVRDNVIGSSTALANGRKLARTSTGRWWCVYVAEDGGAIDQIYASYSDDNGVTWTEEQVSAAPNNQDAPSIVIDPLDNINVVWIGRGWGLFPARRQILFRQRTGAGWQATELATDDNNRKQFYPSVALDTASNFHIVWQGRGGGGLNPGTYNIQYINRSAAGVWGVQEKVSDRADQQFSPAIAVDSLDIIHVAWDARDWGVNVGIRNIRYRQRLTGVWGVHEEVTDEPQEQMAVSISIDSLDNVHIVWYGIHAGWVGATQIQYRMRTVAGVWQAQEQATSIDGAGYEQVNPSIAMDSADIAHITWAAEGFGANPADNNIQYRQRSGGIWQPITSITDRATDQGYPGLIDGMASPNYALIFTGVDLITLLYTVEFFTSAVVIPTVTTDPVSARSQISATLNGLLDDDGGEACEVGFQWGFTPAYGVTTQTDSKVTGETFSQPIRGLFPNTTYHFRAFATNSAGTAYGADRSFTTTPTFSRAFALAREEL